MEDKDDWIDLINSPDEFKLKLKNNPELIFTDSTIQSAIKSLRILCLFGNPDQSDRAKKLLKDCGISVFIPKEAKVRRTTGLVFIFIVATFMQTYRGDCPNPNTSYGYGFKLAGMNYEDIVLPGSEKTWWRDETVAFMCLAAFDSKANAKLCVNGFFDGKKNPRKAFDCYWKTKGGD